MKFKKINHWLHLYLGLTSGIIVFIVALTGCIYVFQKDISEALNTKAVFIQPRSDAQQLPLSKLKEIAENAIDGNKITYITTYADHNRSWEFLSYKTTNPNAFFYFDTIKTYLNVRINPYTGQVTQIKNYKYEFFNIIKYLHWSLLINHQIGQQIVGISTLIFIFLLISGLILWWPKNFKKTTLKQSFKIKWNARFKRLNYDLHNVLGFYAMLIALLLALTGVVWTYQWIANSMYRLAAGKLPSTDKIYTSKLQGKLPNINSLDQIFINAKNILMVQNRITLSLASTTDGVIYVSGYPNDSVYYGSDDLQFDQYNAKLLTSKFNSRKNNGERLLSMNYDIHVGSIFGLSGKIIAFMASLIAASLPITGFIFWLGRRKKK